MHNLLIDPLIRFDRSEGGRAEASLPQVYAALMADEVEAFPALRPHQRHAWHAFLVQLGAMAMHRANVDTPPDTAGEWENLIRGLTPEPDYPDDEPWRLVVDDITKPAFMQPPASSQEQAKDYKSEIATPDELDMLVTSKNHDLKSAVAVQASVDDWAFALVTLQTMEGYGGRYNYGISRMPSGYGNRPAFSLTPSVRPGAHVKHDLAALVAYRSVLLDKYPTSDSGIGLLWAIRWDGNEAEAVLVSQLDPYYIEVCRRVRLLWKFDKLAATRANSHSRRVVDIKGLTGDPWAPVSNNTNPKGTPPAFLTQRRFGYARVVDGLLSPDWMQPILLRSPQPSLGSGGDMHLVARGLVRGEGGTEGYHERSILLRQSTVRVFGQPNGPRTLGEIAKSRIEQVAIVQRILSHAIQVFVARGDSGNINPESRTRVHSWLNQLDRIVDACFFDDLQDEFEADESECSSIRKEWLNGKDGVVDHARVLLRDAEDTLPCPVVHRYRARAEADSLFENRIRREVMAEFDERGEEE